MWKLLTGSQVKRCSSLTDLQKNSEQLLGSFKWFYSDQTSSSSGTNVRLPKPEELDLSQRCRSSKLAAIIRPAVLDHMASVRSLGFLQFWVLLSLVRPPERPRHHSTAELQSFLMRADKSLSHSSQPGHRRSVSPVSSLLSVHEGALSEVDPSPVLRQTPGAPREPVARICRSARASRSESEDPRARL